LRLNHIWGTSLDASNTFWILRRDAGESGCAMDPERRKRF
jgi:hypothetical protein